MAVFLRSVLSIEMVRYVFSGPGTGEKERKSIMQKKINTDKPIGKMKSVEDFLPAPEELIVPGKTVKVTILLSEASIESFKKLARKHHTKYQKLIRNLVDKYAEKYLIHE